MHGRVARVTGGGRGIGREAARSSMFPCCEAAEGVNGAAITVVRGGNCQTFGARERSHD